MSRRELALATAVAAALEALDAGDHRHAVEVLLSVQEDAGRAKQNACPACSLALPWPCALAEHVRVVHPEIEAAA